MYESGLGKSLLHLVSAVGLHKRLGFMPNILGLHFDLHVLLNVLPLDRHMLVVTLLQLSLRTVVEG